mgnify:CR=1 FL=1
MSNALISFLKLSLLCKIQDAEGSLKLEVWVTTIKKSILFFGNFLNNFFVLLIDREIISSSSLLIYLLLIPVAENVRH